MLRTSVISILVSSAIFLAGCGAASKPSASSTAPVVAASSDRDLEQAGHWSENLYDRALAGDWTGAATDLQSLRESLERLQTSFRGSEHLASAIAATTRVSAAISARDARALAREANAVTRDVALLTAGTNPAVPADVTLLDFYGRELEIWADAGDSGNLRKTQREAAETWARLAPLLTARGATAERDQFSALMKRLEDARTIDAFRALAKPILDEVDNLEKVFKPGP